MPGWINVPVRIETRERLDKAKGAKEQSYDSLINELLDVFEHSSKPTPLKDSKG